MRIQTLVTAPSSLPVTVQEAKDHLRVFFDDDDILIERLIKVATAKVEQDLQRKLITQTWKMFFDKFPVVRKIDVLFGDLQSVTHIKYTDSDGTQATFASDDYDVDTYSVPGMIRLGYQKNWPTDTLYPTNPIEIQFVTGYGDTATDVPQDIRAAILLMISHYYENREPVLMGVVAPKMLPKAIEYLLNAHRLWRWIL